MLYQLIAQVIGLAFLATTAALLMRPMTGATRGDLLRHGVLTGLAGAGLTVFYPEVAPFLVLGFVGWLAVRVVRRRGGVIPALAVCAIAAVVAALLLRGYLFDAVQVIVTRSSVAAPQPAAGKPTDQQAVLFPYFLLPEGLADFWGFLRLSQWEDEPYQSIVIALGGVLLLVAVAATIWLCWRGEPVAFVAAAMWALGLLLIRVKSGFALFKLAMYIQPFVIGTIVVAWLAVVRPRKRKGEVPSPPSWRVTLLRVVPLAALATVGLNGQRGYVATSHGYSSTLVEVPNPSKLRVAAQFRHLVEDHPSEPAIISDTYNNVVAKFEALYMRGRTLAFPSNAFFEIVDDAVSTHWQFLDPARAAIAQDLADKRAAALMVKAKFDLHDPADPALANEFLQTDFGLTRAGAGGDALFVQTMPRLSLFNRRRFDPASKEDFLAVPFPRVRDHLIFVASKLGSPYYFQNRRAGEPSIYQLEEDPLFLKPDTMAAVSQYLLLQAVHPSPKVRLVLNMSCTYMADGENQLPPAAVVGAARTKLPVVGRGSMRVFSEPVDPQDVRRPELFHARHGRGRPPARREAHGPHEPLRKRDHHRPAGRRRLRPRRFRSSPNRNTKTSALRVSSTAQPSATSRSARTTRCATPTSNTAACTKTGACRRKPTSASPSRPGPRRSSSRGRCRRGARRVRNSRSS